MAKIITIRPRGRDGDGVQERAAGVYKSHQLQIPADYLRTHPKVDRFQPAQWTQEDWSAAISHTLDSLHIGFDQRGEMLNDPAKRNIAKLVQSFYGGMQQVSSSAESKSGGAINPPTIYFANQEWMDKQGVGKGINHLYRPTDPAGPTVTLSAEYIVDLAKNQLGVITDRSMAGKNKVTVTSTRASNRGSFFLDGVTYSAYHVFREVYPEFARKNPSRNLMNMNSVVEFDAQPEKMLALLFEMRHVATELGTSRRGAKDYDDGSAIVLLKRIEAAWSRFEGSRFEDIEGFAEHRSHINELYLSSLTQRGLTPSGEVARLTSRRTPAKSAA